MLHWDATPGSGFAAWPPSQSVNGPHKRPAFVQATVGTGPGRAARLPVETSEVAARSLRHRTGPRQRGPGAGRDRTRPRTSNPHRPDDGIVDRHARTAARDSDTSCWPRLTGGTVDAGVSRTRPAKFILGSERKSCLAEQHRGTLRVSCYVSGQENGDVAALVVPSAMPPGPSSGTGAAAVASLNQDTAVSLIRLAYLILSDRQAAEDVVHASATFTSAGTGWQTPSACPGTSVPAS